MVVALAALIFIMLPYALVSAINIAEFAAKALSAALGAAIFFFVVLYVFAIALKAIF